jgi:hypothetical protein
MAADDAGAAASGGAVDAFGAAAAPGTALG